MVCFTICTDTSRHNNGSKDLQITTSTINHRLIFQYYFNPENVNPNIDSTCILLDEPCSDVYSNPSKDKTENENINQSVIARKQGYKNLPPLTILSALCYAKMSFKNITPKTRYNPSFK